MRVAVIHASELAADPALLSVPEREALETICGERRRDEWIRGRVALRRLLGDDTSVIIAPDGAPLPVGGAPCSVSLSHDGDWLAVAVAETPIGIDLCVRDHAARVARILAWLGVRGEVEPLAGWAALEAALKLRRLPIEALRDRAIEVGDANRPDRRPGVVETNALGSRPADRIIVQGLGDPVTVSIRHADEYVVGLAA